MANRLLFLCVVSFAVYFSASRTIRHQLYSFAFLFVCCSSLVVCFDFGEFCSRFFFLRCHVVSFPKCLIKLDLNCCFSVVSLINESVFVCISVNNSIVFCLLMIYCCAFVSFIGSWIFVLMLDWIVLVWPKSVRSVSINWRIEFFRWLNYAIVCGENETAIETHACLLIKFNRAAHENEWRNDSKEKIREVRRNEWMMSISNLNWMQCRRALMSFGWSNWCFALMKW